MKIITTLVLMAALLTANATSSAQLLKLKSAKVTGGKASRIRANENKTKDTAAAVTTNVLYGRF